MSTDVSASPIPEGNALLHIGPHKTGSTAIQDALHQARREMASQGVRYASARRHDGPAARWVTDRMIPGQDAARGQRLWEEVVAAMRDRSYARRVFSSEFLSDATDAQIDRIVDALGADQTYVVLTLRPIAKILPSQYQQSVHRGSVAPYQPWLEQVLRFPDSPIALRFWRRHRHDELVRRWGERLGFDRVIALVVDASDFSMAPRSFEGLLGLAAGTLADKKVMANRSYTLAELELVRRFHEQARAEGMTEARRHRLILRASRHVKSRVPEKGEAKLYTPDWAVEAANGVGQETIDNLSRYGVRIIGDLNSLAEASLDTGVEVADVQIDPDLAVRFAVGMGLGVLRDEKVKAVEPTPPTQHGRGLMSAVASRVKRQRR